MSHQLPDIARPQTAGKVDLADIAIKTSISSNGDSVTSTAIMKKQPKQRQKIKRQLTRSPVPDDTILISQQSQYSSIQKSSPSKIVEERILNRNRDLKKYDALCMSVRLSRKLKKKIFIPININSHSISRQGFEKSIDSKIADSMYLQNESDHIYV